MSLCDKADRYGCGLLLALGLSLAADAAPIPQPAELVWGFSEFEPYKYKDAMGFHGIDVSLLELLAKRLDLKLRTVECPFRRCLSYMESGKIDLLTSVAWRDERAVYIDYIQPPYKTNVPVAVYLRSDSALVVDKYEDLYKLKIGVKNGVDYFPRFDHDPKMQREMTDSVLINLRKLEHGRLDAVINTSVEVDYLIIKYGLSDKIKKAPFSNETKNAYFGLSKKSKFIARKAEFDAAMAELVATHQVDAIRDALFNQVRQDSKDRKDAGNRKDSKGGKDGEDGKGRKDGKDSETRSMAPP